MQGSLVNIFASEDWMVSKPLDLAQLKASGRLTISVEETAGFLGISLGSARKAVRNGELPALKLGARWLVPVPKLLRMLGDE